MKKNPLITLVLSIFLPGAPHAYLGKYLCGALTAIFFYLSVFVFLKFTGGSDKSAVLLSGMAMRLAVMLYIFNLLDSCFLTREINSGEAAARKYNPRIAAVLNLTTRGFGYFYLGQKAKGVLFFIVIGILGKASMKIDNDWLSLALEVVLLFLAADGWRQAVKINRESLVQAPASAPADAAKGAQFEFSDAPRYIALSISAICFLAYMYLILVGLFVPSYDSPDRHSRRLEHRGDIVRYVNTQYGYSFTLPDGFIEEKGESDALVSGKFCNESASLSFYLQSIVPPFSTYSDIVKSEMGQFEKGQWDTVFQKKEKIAGRTVSILRYRKMINGRTVVMDLCIVQHPARLTAAEMLFVYSELVPEDAISAAEKKVIESAGFSK